MDIIKELEKFKKICHEQNAIKKCIESELLKQGYRHDHVNAILCTVHSDMDILILLNKNYSSELVREIFMIANNYDYPIGRDTYMCLKTKLTIEERVNKINKLILES